MPDLTGWLSHGFRAPRPIALSFLTS